MNTDGLLECLIALSRPVLVNSPLVCTQMVTDSEPQTRDNSQKTTTTVASVRETDFTSSPGLGEAFPCLLTLPLFRRSGDRGGQLWGLHGACPVAIDSQLQDRPHDC